MTYKFDGKEYDEDDFDSMTDKELDDLRDKASKFARDQDLVIARKKMEWEEHGRDPNYGLPRDEYKRRKLEMANALGLMQAIKYYIPPVKD